MKDRILKILCGAALVLVLGTGSAFGQAQAAPAAQAGQKPQKNWKDPAEFDLYTAVTKEASDAKKLELLDNWKNKYPSSEFKLERLQLYLITYQKLGKPDKMVETAKEILAVEPKDIQALYWLTFLTPTLNKTDADTLDTGDKAAKGLLGAEKPPATADADWSKAKTDMEGLAHKTQGWIEMQRKNNEGAEKEFAKSLEVNPNQGEVSYWLGTMILGQKKPERQSEVLYHFARAASYDGPGALTPEGRKQVDAYFVKAYNTFHGADPKSLEDLRTMAKSKAMPPADFKIENVNEISAKKEEEFKKSNPQLALWMGLKKQLMEEGDTYFQTVKGAGIPGGVQDIKKFKGTIISHKPAVRPKEIVVGVENPNVPDATLKLETPLAGKADPGTPIEFEGVVESYAKAPFMLTLTTEKDKIIGWPATAAPAPARKAPARRPGAAKKKK